MTTATLRPALVFVAALGLALFGGASLAWSRYRVPHIVATAGDCRVEIGGP